MAKHTEVCEIRPLKDSRWSQLIATHPRSSVFHTAAWLETLRRTFHYEPVALTTSAPDCKLQNAIVLCRIDSWITGSRLVSLPFSDHCDPLVDDTTNVEAVLLALQSELVKNRIRYAEIRPLHASSVIAGRSSCIFTYCSHQIDLIHNTDSLFRRCHKSSTQRKIRRAEREGLTYEEGRSEVMLDQFYRLLVLTRRRHNSPPQPKIWFQNLIDCFGSALKIRLASKGTTPIAGLLTLHHKDALVYKYGCSDARFHRVGGMQFLFWKAITEAKMQGLRVFDLGRSEWGHQGLITFKDHLGASRSELRYSRLAGGADPSAPVVRAASTAWKERAAKMLFRHVSDRAFCSAGEFICKHLA